MTIDEIYSTYYASQLTGTNSISPTAAAAADDTASGSVGAISTGQTDSYVSTVTSEATALPSDNYNDILTQIKQAQAALTTGSTSNDTQSGTSASDASAETESAGGTSGSAGAGGSGSASSGDDSDETTTTIVMINGQAYLETTTTSSDGTTTVTRVPLGADSEQES